VGNLTIPILFYKKDNRLKGTYDPVFSQIDILPTTLSLLDYPEPFFAFGSGTNENNPKQPYYYETGTHFDFTNSMAYLFANSRLQHVFKYSRDSALASNLAGHDPVNDSLATMRFRAFLQTYNHTLIHNKSVVKNPPGK